MKPVSKKSVRSLAISALALSCLSTAGSPLLGWSQQRSSSSNSLTRLVNQGLDALISYTAETLVDEELYLQQEYSQSHGSSTQWWTNDAFIRTQRERNLNAILALQELHRNHVHLEGDRRGIRNNIEAYLRDHAGSFLTALQDDIHMIDSTDDTGLPRVDGQSPSQQNQATPAPSSQSGFFGNPRNRLTVGVQAGVREDNISGFSVPVGASVRGSYEHRFNPRRDHQGHVIQDARGRTTSYTDRVLAFNLSALTGSTYRGTATEVQAQTSYLFGLGHNGFRLQGGPLLEYQNNYNPGGNNFSTLGLGGEGRIGSSSRGVMVGLRSTVGQLSLESAGAPLLVTNTLGSLVTLSVSVNFGQLLNTSCGQTHPEQCVNVQLSSSVASDFLDLKNHLARYHLQVTAPLWANGHVALFARLDGSHAVGGVDANPNISGQAGVFGQLDVVEVVRATDELSQTTEALRQLAEMLRERPSRARSRQVTPPPAAEQPAAPQASPAAVVAPVETQPAAPASTTEVSEPAAPAIVTPPSGTNNAPADQQQSPQNEPETTPGGSDNDGDSDSGEGNQGVEAPSDPSKAPGKMSNR